MGNAHSEIFAVVTSIFPKLLLHAKGLSSVLATVSEVASMPSFSRMAESQMKSSLTLFVCSTFSDLSMAKHNPRAAQPEQDGRIDAAQRQVERLEAG
jgi:hypothetical protein